MATSNQRTPSLEILHPLSSDGEFPSDDSFTSDESDGEYERNRLSGSFSSMKAFFKGKLTAKKTKVISIMNLSQEPKGKKADDRNELFITRVLERNRFLHSSRSLGGYINVPFPPGFMPSEVIVPASVLQNDVKFDRFLKHSVATDGTQWAVLNSSTYTVKCRPLRARGMASDKDPILPTKKETAWSSSRPHPEDGYRHCNGKKYGTADRKINGVTHFPKRNQTVYQPSEFASRASMNDWRFPSSENMIQGELRLSDQDLSIDNGHFSRARRNVKRATRDKKKKDKDSGCVEHHLTNGRWATPCLKLPDSDEETCSKTEKSFLSPGGLTEEVKQERRALETYLAKECSGHRRSAICEEIENVKQIAKVNGLRMNLRLLREDLACVKTTDQS